MKPAAEKFEKFLAPIKFNEPKFAVFTNTTGQEVKTPDEIKTALVKQVTGSVLWEDCFANMTKLGVEQFYECGMGGVLTNLGKRIVPEAKVTAVATAQELAATVMV
jgi:[acyl-carrier-protein] S-malonyltransferase